MTLDDLGGRLFVDVPQAAEILGRDRRTIRRAAEAREIPATKVGSKWMIQTAWIREQAGQAPAPAAALPDLDEMVERIAARTAAIVLGAFAGLSPAARADDDPGEVA